MIDRFTVSEAARRTGCRPRDISTLFYDRILGDDDAPIVGGRRMIPESLLPKITQLLTERCANRRGRAAPESEKTTA
jgi:hypothetical protein